MASKEQMEKSRKFRKKVLWAAHNFGGYITPKNAAKITAYTERSAIIPLRRLVDQGMLIEHKIVAGGSKILVFTISKEGRKFAADGDLGKSAQAFSIKRVRPSTLNHEMTIQRICAIIHDGPESGHRVSKAKIIGGREVKGRITGGRRPDAMYNDDEVIEIELTIKSIKRYTEICDIYNRTETKSYWFVPENIVHRLDRIFDEILPAKYCSLYEVYALSKDDDLTLSEGQKDRTKWLDEQAQKREQEAKAEEQKRLREEKKSEQRKQERAKEIEEEKRARELKLAQDEALNIELKKRLKIQPYIITITLILAYVALHYGSRAFDELVKNISYFISVSFFLISAYLWFEGKKIKKYLDRM